jgi:hypothetical protein
VPRFRLVGLKIAASEPINNLLLALTTERASVTRGSEHRRRNRDQRTDVSPCVVRAVTGQMAECVLRPQVLMRQPAAVNLIILPVETGGVYPT